MPELDEVILTPLESLDLKELTKKPEMATLSTIPQGAGSNLDSDTVRGKVPISADEAGDVVIPNDLTATGDITAVTLTVTGAAPSPPAINTTYKESVIKAHINFNGNTGTANDSYNCSSARNSQGNYTITFDRDFANANYAAVGSCNAEGGTVRVAHFQSHAVGSIVCIVRDHDGNLQDTTTVSAIFIGDQ